MTGLSGPASALLLLGPTGSGKTPLGEMIEERGINGTRCRHFDFGRQLRLIARQPQPPASFTAAEHGFVREVLEQGALLEDRHFPIAEKIVLDFLAARGFSSRDLLVLNGFPRHQGQARNMQSLVSVIGLIVLDCEAGDVCVRIGRNTGGDRVDRADDTVGMISRKLAVFRERTEPLITHYAEQGARVCRISMTAETAAADAYAELPAFPFPPEVLS